MLESDFERVKTIQRLEVARLRLANIKTEGDSSPLVREYSERAEEGLEDWLKNPEQFQKDVQAVYDALKKHEGLATYANTTSHFIDGSVVITLQRIAAHHLFNPTSVAKMMTAMSTYDFFKGYGHVQWAVQAAHSPENENRVKPAELLRQDPSGMGIVDWAVDHIKAGGINRGLDLTEFVVGGAETSRKAYKRVYPLVEAVLSQTQS